MLYKSSVLCWVSQSCPTLSDPMDCSPPGTSVHGSLQARILEWVAMPSSRGSSQPRDQTQISRTAGKFFTVWATKEAHKRCSSQVFIVSNLLNHFVLLQVQPSYTKQDAPFSMHSHKTEKWKDSVFTFNDTQTAYRRLLWSLSRTDFTALKGKWVAQVMYLFFLLF